MSSDSSGTRSVLVTSRNGVGGTVQTRFGGGGPPGGPVGTFAYAGPWGFPYWNDNGAYASASAGSPYPYNYPPPYPYDPYYDNGNYGNGVYSSNDANGIQTRFANVPANGQATIVEQTGNDAPRVYSYRATPTREIVEKVTTA